MLTTSTYPRRYVDEVRASLDAQVAAYDQLVMVANAGGGDAAVDAALEALEPVVFNNLLIALEAAFTHRARTPEGEEGNPLTEVRILSNALLANRGVFTLDPDHATWHATLRSDRTVRYQPEQSVLGYKEGDAVSLHREDFVCIAAAFFAQVEEKLT